MKDSSEVLSCVVCLEALARSDEETGGRPLLPPRSREHFIAVLKRIVLVPGAHGVLAHAASLSRFLTGFRHGWCLSEEEEHYIVMGEWNRVDDQQLAKLILSPTALLRLHARMKS